MYATSLREASYYVGADIKRESTRSTWPKRSALASIILARWKTESVSIVVLKIFGFLVCCIGVGLWYVDYLIFAAIGAMTGWIAETIGITGHAVLGVQAVGWILTFGIMILFGVWGAVLMVIGLRIMGEE